MWRRGTAGLGVRQEFIRRRISDREALEKTRETIASIVNRSEIIRLDVSAKPKSGDLYMDTPWKYFGIFKDNPSWGKVFAEIDKNKKNSGKRI